MPVEVVSQPSKVVQVAANEYVVQVQPPTARVTTVGLQGPVGATGPAGSGATYHTRTVTANYTVTTNDDVILADATAGQITLTLPAPATGKIYYLKKIDGSANLVVVQPTAGVQIDTGDSVELSRQTEVIGIVSDGSTWWVLVACMGLRPA